MTVDITRLAPGVQVKKDFFLRLERFMNQVLEEEGLAGGEVNVVLVEDSYMHRLNKKYRDVDATTDVLSFCYLERAEEEQQGGESFALGDIYISLDRALQQAEKAGHDTGQELLLLALHGMLHLLGYDHCEKTGEDRMRAKEMDLVKRFIRSIKNN